MNIPYKPGRLLAAIILPPLIASAAAAFFFAMFIAASAGDPDSVIVIFIFTMYGGVLIGIPTMLALGLPIHAILCKTNKRTGAMYALLGAVVGGIGGFVAPMIAFEAFKPDDAFLNYLFGGFGIPAGAIAAPIFHHIRGPHLALTDAPNDPT